MIALFISLGGVAAADTGLLPFSLANNAGQTGLSVDSSGQTWIHATGSNTARLILSADGYNTADTLISEIGSSPVASISSGGELESYNYYVYPDTPRLSVRDTNDNFIGGITGSGAIVTSSHAAPWAQDMRDGSAWIWYDQTPVTGGLMVSEKDSAGNVRTIRVG
jgi:hypothetical protein